MMKKGDKDHYPKGKKKVIGLIKYERGGKLITKFATISPTTYRCRVQKSDHEIEDSEFIKG